MSDVTDNGRKPNGFAAMDPEKRRAAASRGGKSAHASQRAHCFTTDEARAAGTKGGAVVSADREHMATIGRLGAKKRNASTTNTRRSDEAMSVSALDSHELPETD